MTSTKLNPEAASFTYEMSPISNDFNEFFTLLFTNWGENKIDSIVSGVVTIKTIGLAKMLFDQLFKIIYALAKNSSTELKVDNIITTIDVLDNQLPQLIIDNSAEPATAVLQSYFSIRKESFETCFKRILHSFELVVETKSVVFRKELEDVLLVLAKISKIRYYEDYVELFVDYLRTIYLVHGTNNDIVLCIIQTISWTVDRLLLFLLLSIDPEKSKEVLEKERRRAKLAVRIFADLRDDLVMKKFTSAKDDLVNQKLTREMIVHVLHILDQRDRFLGQYVDAVPENRLINGFIVCSTYTGTFESEDVYDDYESFLDSS